MSVGVISRRVAWILYGSLEQRTGGTIYDARIVEGLRARGDRVDVFSLDRARSTRDAPELVRALRRASPDVIVGDELCFRELAWVFARVTFARRVLLVHHLTCWEHELAPLTLRRARRGEAKALRCADALITTSRATRARLVLEGHRRAIDVVQPGADRLDATVAARGDRVTFAFVGALSPRKRVLELLDAFAAVGEEAQLRLIGAAPDRAYQRRVARAVAELGLADRVTLVGEIEDAAVACELAAADVLVMPSSLEGYGIAATEAIHAGTPVIARRTAGLAEALAPCPGATVFVDSTATLALAMRAIATNEGHRVALQRAAATSRMPTWAGAVDAFRTALARQGRPPPTR